MYQRKSAIRHYRDDYCQPFSPPLTSFVLTAIAGYIGCTCIMPVMDGTPLHSLRVYTAVKLNSLCCLLVPCEVLSLGTAMWQSPGTRVTSWIGHAISFTALRGCVGMAFSPVLPGWAGLSQFRGSQAALLSDNRTRSLFQTRRNTCPLTPLGRKQLRMLRVIGAMRVAMPAVTYRNLAPLVIRARRSRRHRYTGGPIDGSVVPCSKSGAGTGGACLSAHDLKED